MSASVSNLQTQTSGTTITRFNALKHGILSRCTVLPWEDADEYRAIVAALIAEHAPQGPTEEHLVEELAGILWRKRRLRLAEAAVHRRGLEATLKPYRETAKAALVHIDGAGTSECAADAVRTTDSEAEEDLAMMAADEAMTRQALDVLGSQRNDAYELALATLRQDTRAWWADELARDRGELPMLRACGGSSKPRCCRGLRGESRNSRVGRSFENRRLARLLIPTSSNGLADTRCISTASSSGCYLCCCVSRISSRAGASHDPFRKIDPG